MAPRDWFRIEFAHLDNSTCLACYIRVHVDWRNWRTRLEGGDEIRCTDCHSTLRVIDN